MATDGPPSSNPWDWIYATRPMDGVGWFEPDPSNSRELIDRVVANGARSVIDVGGGASRLVDHLIDLSVERVAVLDISEAGLAFSKHRLGSRAEEVEWIVGDVASIGDVGRYDLWHDRAAFHFLLDDVARRHYIELAAQTVPIGGTAIVATFAEDGPERCSGMPIVRYAPDQLAAAFAPAFRSVDSRRFLHHTPAGVPQQFQYSTMERVDTGGQAGRQP